MPQKAKPKLNHWIMLAITAVAFLTVGVGIGMIFEHSYDESQITASSPGKICGCPMMPAGRLQSVCRCY